MNVSKRCYKCNGYGLIKTKIIYCKNCNGLKCYKCRGTGFLQYGWSECPRCIGVGSDGEETKLYDRVHNLRKQINK